MGIRQLGESATKELSRLFNDLQDVIQNPLLPKIAERGIKDAWIKSNPINPKVKKISAQESQHRGEIASVYKPIVTSLTKELEPYSISPELGGVASQSTLEYFHSEAGKHLLRKLSELEINPTSENYAPITAAPDGKLAGKTFVITGTLSQPRDYFKELIEAQGGKISSAVSSKTDFLLAGDNAGSKSKKAEELSVKIINEDELLYILSL
jgi:DNA ligase (NAD+)